LSRSAALGSDSELRNIEHVNEFKIWFSLKIIIWIWIIKKFDFKIIEVSHVEIGIKLLKLWNLEVQFWVPILTAIGITVKSNMKMG